ncbi:MAG: 1-acyl-sn-glycerol-3-phosphate acyltransferase [Ignavibacteriae bacterium]|nr:1-acyl-sn-glycerol-3-phosphate acyltransferase [Ignavibacteriota bacterium]MCB9217634.1 1-acyl-sn-glycerol-3-phosphate acyltransferase [Ignavibacteria bacterium]
MNDSRNRSPHPRKSRIRGGIRLFLLLLAALLWIPISVIPIAVASLFGQRKRFLVVTALTGLFCSSMASIVGLRTKIYGKRNPETLVFVANHVSWLDILTAGIAVSSVFVSRHDVKGWPGIGLFARLAGTVFIDRSSLRSAVESSQNIVERTGQGIRVVFFPEGKATDGEDVDPFKAFLFGGITERRVAVQPFTILYTEIGGQPVTPENRDLVYWHRSDQNFLSHAWEILQTSNVQAEIHFREREAPPAEADREGLRNYVAKLREKTAEGVPVWKSRS